MKFKGSIKEFDDNWKNSDEAKIEYWTRNKPTNQTQFSFRNLWILFREIINSNKISGKDVIEIGSGRGTMSSYFSDYGYNSHLLDSSKKAIDISKHIFKKNKHKATFINEILENYKPDKYFDIVFSIGLLEHFKSIKNPLIQQVNLLKKNGLFLCYVVPDYKSENVQKNFIFLNNFFKIIFESKNKQTKKKEIYRNAYNSVEYTKILKKYLKKINVYGVYPLPMISYSNEFPFTVLDNKIEKLILTEFDKIIKKKSKIKNFLILGYAKRDLDKHY